MTEQKPRQGPLTDIRVIELGQLVAGPFCGQLLGDMGAEIIKVEPPDKGDPLRQWGREGYPLWWTVTARNKSCITANLRKPEGQDILKRLVAGADILIENFRPGTMEKWGLGYEALKAVNPGLIMVRVSGYGQTGPYAGRPGYASVGEAMGGLRYLMGEPDRKPSRAGISIGDTLTGSYAAFGALAALHHREKTGEGQMIDASIYESVLTVMEGVIPEFTQEGHIRERTGSYLPGIAPSNIYEARDGMLIIAANQDSVFGRLCEAMGTPELASDKNYASHVARGENQLTLDGVIGAWTAGYTCLELEVILTEHSVPFGKIYTAPEMLADPHFQARGSIIDMPTDAFPDLKMQNVFPRLSKTPGAVRHAGKAELGADTERILTDLLDLTPDQIAKLRKSQIV